MRAVTMSGNTATLHCLLDGMTAVLTCATNDCPVTFALLEASQHLPDTLRRGMDRDMAGETTARRRD